MLHETKRIDESFDQITTTFESREEYERELRTDPYPVPATHVWEYRYEDPTPEQLAKNRYLMPKKIRGPRELGLSEIAGKTKDYETLGLAELRYLCDKYKVPQKSLEKGEPKQDEQTALRGALREFVKVGPTIKDEPKTVQAPQVEPASVLPADIATMDEPTMRTLMTKLGKREEFLKLAGKSMAEKRAFVAKVRGEKEQVKEVVNV
jgi:hypothetical protein